MATLHRWSGRYRAALLTVVYFAVCIGLGAVYTLTSRSSEAEEAAGDAQSEASELRGMIEENQDNISSLRDDVDTLQSQVE